MAEHKEPSAISNLQPRRKRKSFQQPEYEKKSQTLSVASCKTPVNSGPRNSGAKSRELEKWALAEAERGIKLMQEKAEREERNVYDISYWLEDASTLSKRSSLYDFREAFCDGVDSGRPETVDQKPRAGRFSTVEDTIPYYGLEHARDIFDSVNLLDLGFSDFTSSDMLEVIDLLASPPEKPPADLNPRNDSPTNPFDKWMGHFAATYGQSSTKAYPVSTDSEESFSSTAEADLHLRRQSYVKRYFEEMKRRYEPLGGPHKFAQNVFQVVFSGGRAQPGLAMGKVSGDISGESDAWGRRRLVIWKKSSGRGKEWRRCLCGSGKGRLIGEDQLGRLDWPFRSGWNFSPSAVPVNLLRTRPEFKLITWDRALKKNHVRKAATDLQHQIEEDLGWWDEADEEHDQIDDDPISHSPTAVFSIASRSSGHNSLPAPVHEHPDDFDHQDPSSPIFNLIGTILGGRFRILKFLRNENHGEVFAAEDVIPSITIYEAKAYTLRKLSSQATYKYRVRNLKRLCSRSSFEGSFDHHDGRKFVINRLGRDTAQWKEAFPLLEIVPRVEGSKVSKISITSDVTGGSSSGSQRNGNIMKMSPALAAQSHLFKQPPHAPKTLQTMMPAPRHPLLRDGETRSHTAQGRSDPILTYLQAASKTKQPTSTWPDLTANSEVEKVVPGAALPDLPGKFTPKVEQQEKTKKTKTPNRKERDRIKQREKRTLKRIQKITAELAETRRLFCDAQRKLYDNERELAMYERERDVAERERDVAKRHIAVYEGLIKDCIELVKNYDWLARDIPS